MEYSIENSLKPLLIPSKTNFQDVLTLRLSGMINVPEEISFW
ncbi:hypothetical protein Desti_1775 [Desulfomonile tiedjei DSM 6799]|uniref:Uncharacterized protein n=1 Tax=Desulfomonile tiedjei (strain ATCC 49306 / DSM 6799 / DCB-1) TaxID=706587 RepID=I4C4J4_DESTA|nr:hypothetical protein Desti_1775 [Desulfomonile tiedjei DSM 6799]